MFKQPKYQHTLKHLRLEDEQAQHTVTYSYHKPIIKVLLQAVEEREEHIEDLNNEKREAIKALGGAVTPAYSGVRT